MHYTKKFYFMTITPKSRQGSDKFHYDGDRFVITEQLDKCSKHWVVYPEYSDTLRLHYHGIVRIDSLQRWYRHTKKMLEATIGFVAMRRIKSPTDHLRMLLYCMKNYSDFKPYKYIKRFRHMARSNSAKLSRATTPKLILPW